jgi:hypothetical protein
MRFYDKLFPLLQGRFGGVVPIVFEASNIFRLYFHRSSDETIEFPNLAPPYPLYFMEAQAPPRMFVEGRWINWEGSGEWGVLFRARDARKSIPPDDGVCQYITEPHRVRWLMDAGLYFLREGNPALYSITQYALDEHGIRLEIGPGQYYKTTLGFQAPQEMGYPLIESALMFLSPFEWATCFLHCKNIEAADVTPNRKQSDSFQKTSGRPLVQYKTLSIAPGWRKIVGGRGETCGIHPALHICRGHFKKFDDKPLFGKYTGLFWWESQVRGNKKHGIVLKDYKIASPNERGLAQ